MNLSCTIDNTHCRVPFEEQLRDHDSILDAFLTTHTFQNHSKRTLEFDRRYLKGWFSGCTVQDEDHPEGRQLLVWEAMHPEIGRQIIASYASGLAMTDLRHQTCVTYLRRLHALFAHIAGNPWIPAATTYLERPVLIQEKYNPIQNPVSMYDYPPPAKEEPTGESPLVDDQLIDFLSWTQSEFLPKARKKTTAGRTYTQIVTVAECGFRFCELEGLDALPPTRDLDYPRGRIRTRFGKGSRGSGPRTREVAMSPLLQATLDFYERMVRPQFPESDVNPALFLSGRGRRLGYFCARSALRVVIRHARRAGLILPSDMGWHSLRRSFATQFLDRHPDQIWQLLEFMGHESMLSLIRYVRPSPEKVHAVIERVVAKLAG